MKFGKVKQNNTNTKDDFHLIDFLIFHLKLTLQLQFTHPSCKFRAFPKCLGFPLDSTTPAGGFGVVQLNERLNFVRKSKDKNKTVEPQKSRKEKPPRRLPLRARMIFPHQKSDRKWKWRFSSADTSLQNQSEWAEPGSNISCCSVSKQSLWALHQMDSWDKARGFRKHKPSVARLGMTKNKSIVICLSNFSLIVSALLHPWTVVLYLVNHSRPH